MRLSARSLVLVSALALLPALLLAACSGESHELVIEFFDWNPDAGVGNAGWGRAFDVDPDIDADPVYVIEESDIESWDDYQIRFSDEATTLVLDEFVKSGRTLDGLLFRLSIDDDSYWGWVRRRSSAAGYWPPYLSYDVDERVMYLDPGPVTVGDLTLEEAARQAWQD